MSRFYHIWFIVSTEELTGNELESVILVLQGAWDIDSNDGQLSTQAKTYSIGGDSYLTGGETEEAFAMRVIHAVWETVGKFVLMEINATYLENIPSETHFLGEADYEQWSKRQRFKCFASPLLSKEIPKPN